MFRYGTIMRFLLWLTLAFTTGLLSLGVVVVYGILLNIIREKMGLSPIVEAHQAFDQLRNSGFPLSQVIGLFVTASLMAPLIEELAFRGLSQGALKALLPEEWAVRLRMSLAIGVSATCFAVVHGSVVPMVVIPVLLLLGILWGILREASGALWPSMVAHGVFNTIQICIFLVNSGDC